MARRRVEIQRPDFDPEEMKSRIKRNSAAARRRMERRSSAPPGHEAPDFLAFLDDPDAGQPIWDNIEWNGDFEDEAAQETEQMSAALRKIVEEKRERRDKYALLVDQSYYLVLVFQTTEQKVEFVKQKGWESIEGNAGWVYLNGLEVADREGVKLEPVYIPTKEPPQAPKDLRDHPVVE